VAISQPSRPSGSTAGVGQQIMNPELQILPRFTVAKTRFDDFPFYEGIFDRNIHICEGFIGYLVNEENFCLQGRFYKYEDGTKKAIFRPTNERPINNIIIGNIYYFLDGYWGEKVELVLSKKKEWSRQEFIKKDGYEFEFKGMKMISKDREKPEIATGGEGKVRKGGWNHEHCEICEATISEKIKIFGYMSNDGKWVCEKCYQIYVNPRKLGFITNKSLSQIIGEDYPKS
jgi:hypothetical protein